LKTANKDNLPLVGQVIEWEESHDRHRDTCLVRQGLVTQVKGRNVWINDDAKWLPDMKNWRVIGDKPNTEVTSK